MESATVPGQRLRWLHVGAIDEPAWVVAVLVVTGSLRVPPRSAGFWRAAPTATRSGVDPAAAERGRVALTLKGFLKPEWSDGRLSRCRPALGSAGPRSRQRPRRLRRGVPATATVCTRLLTPTTGCRWACDAGIGPGGVEDRLADRLHGLPRRLDRRPELRRAGQYPARLEGRCSSS